MVSLLLVLALALIGCGGSGEAESEEEVDPLDLLTQAADRVRVVETLRLDVTQSGEDYLIAIAPEGEVIDVAFRQARVQYVAPNILQGRVTVIAGGVLPLDVEIFAVSTNQWIRLVGASWIVDSFAPEFDPQSLMQDDSGFQAVFSTLDELEYVGLETLIDGTRAYHIRGVADGAAVTALLVGLIDPVGAVPVEVYLDRDTLYPVRLLLTTVLPPGVDGAGDAPGVDGVEATAEATLIENDPTLWQIEIYDINGDRELTPPEGALDAGGAESTPEATSEAMP